MEYHLIHGSKNYFVMYSCKAPTEAGSPWQFKCFIFASVYSFALAILIASWWATDGLLGLFVHLDVYTLGTAGTIWQSYHIFGCAYAGVINLLVWLDQRGVAYTARARREIAAATAVLYFIWFIQNSVYTIGNKDDVLRPAMWLNVIFCLFTCIFSSLAVVFYWKEEHAAAAGGAVTAAGAAAGFGALRDENEGARKSDPSVPAVAPAAE